MRFFSRTASLKMYTEIINASILTKIQNALIMFFTEERLFAQDGLQHVLGCIDCTHVKIIAPNEYEHEFVNRKNVHSINVQVCANDIVCLKYDWLQYKVCSTPAKTFPF